MPLIATERMHYLNRGSAPAGADPTLIHFRNLEQRHSRQTGCEAQRFAPKLNFW